MPEFSLPTSGGPEVALSSSNIGSGEIALGSDAIGLYDDFNDGNYDGWTVDAKTWTVDNNVLTNTSSNNAEISNTDYRMGAGTWEWDHYRHNQNYGAGTFFYNHGAPPHEGSDRCYIAYHHNGNQNFAHVLNNSVNGVTVVRTDGMATGWNHHKITRSSDGVWEYLVDGVSYGTATDNLTPPSEPSEYVTLHADSNEKKWDNINFQP